VRYVVGGLGILTIVLAAWLANEGQWWIAIPDGLFGLGIAWIARNSLHEEHHVAVAPPAPTLVPAPPPQAVSPQPPAPQPRPDPRRRRGGHGHGHNRPAA